MRFALLVATIAGGMAVCTSVSAAQKPVDGQWVGSWEYVEAPLPPGITPAAPAPVPPPAPMPLGQPTPASASPPPAPAAPPRAPAPLLDNPGNVPFTAGATDLVNTTAREVVRVSAGGGRLRLRFSNESGADPLVLGSVHVAEAAADGSIVPGSDRTVEFAGRAGVIIPPSAPALSDPVDLATRPLEKLYVSVYIPGPLSARAQRSLIEYVAGEPGDYTGDAALPQVHLMRVPSLLTLVEVQSTKAAGVVVALGDSITEGALSTANAFRSWPDRLAERLEPYNWAVVNAGISGNRLLRYGAGPNALARLDRDVLSVPGIRAIILLEGINDIGRGFSPAGATEPVTAEALEAADQQIIARAHEHGVRVIGATLTPYQGASYASAAGEAVRQALNTWIKTAGAFDGVIDFAPAVADAGDPLTFAKAYNDRDHLHPNDAGYKVMADAIDLKVITGK